MRIALFADIHGNARALERVLAAVEDDAPDAAVFLGDVATNGPEPREVIALLKQKAYPMVLGNTDADLLNPPHWYAQPDSPELPESAQRVYAISAWCHAQLTGEDLDYLRTFLPTVTIPLGERDSLLGFHGSPRAATDVVRPTTSDDELDLMLAGATAQVLAGGHLHVPLMRNHRGRMVLNPGSVGFPFASYGLSGQVPVLPEAQYAVVSAVDGFIDVQFRRIAVDVDAITQAARSSGMPHAEWWSALWLRR